jgi:hypothetical protein
MSESDFPRNRFSRLPAWDDDGFDHYDLEQWIKAAGSYVRAGDQLRPQVIDQVKQRAARRGAWKPLIQFTSWGLSAALIWSLSVYAIFLVVPRGLTASDIYQRAEKRAETSGMSLDWALSEVFKESRLPGKPQVAAKPWEQRRLGIHREGSTNE